MAGKSELEPYDQQKDEWLLNNTSQAAHEPCAALRLQRRGLRGQALVDATKIRPTQLQHVIQKALDDEGWAFQRGCPIHDQASK